MRSRFIFYDGGAGIMGGGGEIGLAGGRLPPLRVRGIVGSVGRRLIFPSTHASLLEGKRSAVGGSE